ncbi:MAG: arsenate reductase [Saprospiraceae bacterium]
MKKIYHLSTCDTNRRILKNLNVSQFEMVDIKHENITEDVLDYAKTRLGSYLKLFNTKCLLYRDIPQEKRPKRDIGYRKFILSHYTYLKRPVIIDGEKVFSGSEKENLIALETFFAENYPK